MPKCVRFLGLLVLCAIAQPAAAQRLPTSVTPEHYDLAFSIDLQHERFSGTTGIDVRVAQAATTIRLNALDMDITRATIASGGRTQTATVAMDAKEQTAALTVPNAIPAGNARIEIEYHAPLNTSLRGLYISRTRKRAYAVTQFESTDARRAFPCFDEPSFKATFSLTVTIDRGDTVISNGRLLKDTPGPLPAQHTMTFAPTAKMSSYLVAMAIGDFECLSGQSEGVPIRVCATPDKRELGHIALDSAQQILSYLNAYNSIKYPFGKLDVVAVPDFAAGAMENTAAIFYRETDLLADSATASPSTRRTIMTILSHEMAHMWFGDLVTMAWWDDVWLNESFATWMAARPAKTLHPEWHMDLSEAGESQTALNLDSLSATHPIHATVSTPEEIESLFDPISYEKGASVLRMIESYVGDAAFKSGVNAYISKHAYSNATSEDFFGALTTASGKPVDRIMATFVLQAGLPQLNVTTSCANGKASATLSQRRFLLDGSTSSGRERWQVPVCLKTPGAKEPACTVVTEPTQTIPLGDQCVPWAFANAGGRGYYRTAYSADEIKALARDLETSLTPPERLSLLSDEWALVRAGQHSVANYMDLASGFGRERMPEVLATATARLAYIDENLATSEMRPKLHAFINTLLQPAYREVGFDRAASDNEERRTLRNILVGVLGGVTEDPDVISRAQRAVNDAMHGGAALDPILANTLVNITARRGDAALFDAFAQAAERATSPDEHYRYLYALTSFTNPALVQRALDLSTSPTLRSQDTALYLGAFIIGNETARDTAWSFVKAHWTAIEPKVNVAGSDSNLVNSLSAFCSVEARDDIRAFFTAHPLPTAARSLKQTIERIDNCIATRQREQAPLGRWLSERP